MVVGEAKGEAKGEGEAEAEAAQEPDNWVGLYPLAARTTIGSASRNHPTVARGVAVPQSHTARVAESGRVRTTIQAIAWPLPSRQVANHVGDTAMQDASAIGKA